MPVDIEQVVRRRGLVLTLLRCLAVAFLVLGALPMLELASYMFVVTPFYAVTSGGSAPAIDWGEAIITAAAQSGKYVFAALLLLSMQQFLVRWLVPIPPPGCPRCGYDIDNLAESRCPECGLQLPGSDQPASEDETE